MQLFLSLVDRVVEFRVLTNELIVLHLLGIKKKKKSFCEAKFHEVQMSKWYYKTRTSEN